MRRLLAGAPVLAVCAVYLAVQPMSLLAAAFFAAGSLVAAAVMVALG